MMYINWMRVIEIVEAASSLQVTHGPGPYSKRRREDSEIAVVTGLHQTVNIQLWDSTIRAICEADDREEALAACLVYHYYVTIAKRLFHDEGNMTAFALGKVDDMLRRRSILSREGKPDGPVR